MSERVILTYAAPTKRRRKLLLLGLAALIVLAVPASYWFVLIRAGWEIEKAVSEADQLDPGWRFEDLEAARADVPDDENAAFQVLAARGALSRPWQLPSSPESLTIIGQIEDLSPEIRLHDKLEQEVRQTIAQFPTALAAARRIADMPRGRYVVGWAADPLGTRVPHLEDAMAVEQLLTLDAVLRVQDRDIDGALESVRAILNTGRSIGDEPAPASQRVRAWCGQTCLRNLERVLAHGEAKATNLEVLQKLLEDEARQPLQLIFARSDRAMIFGHLEFVRAGKFDRTVYGMSSSPLGSKADDFLDRGKATAGEAAYFRYLTRYVEIAKLPPEQQHDLLGDLQPPQVAMPRLLEVMSTGDDFRKIADSFHRSLAWLRCGIAALAAERYRLEHGRWPDDLKTLVPLHLGEIPVDPYDGMTLRFRRRDDGLVIYSIGPDREDNGGTIDRSPRKLRPGWRGKDIGFRLWDVGRREQEE